MEKVFYCYEEPMDKLEVATQVFTVRLTMKPNGGEEATVVLDKRGVVELISTLSEYLINLEY